MCVPGSDSSCSWKGRFLLPVGSFPRAVTEGKSRITELLLLLWDGTGDVQSWRKGRASSRVASKGLVWPLGHPRRASGLKGRGQGLGIQLPSLLVWKALTVYRKDSGAK